MSNMYRRLLVFLCLAVVCLSCGGPKPSRSWYNTQNTTNMWLSDFIATDPDTHSNETGSKWRITRAVLRECEMHGNEAECNPAMSTRNWSESSRFAWVNEKWNSIQGDARHRASWFQLTMRSNVVYEIQLSIVDDGDKERRCRTGIIKLCQGGEERRGQGEPLEFTLSTKLTQKEPGGVVFKGLITADTSSIELANVDDTTLLCKEEKATVWFAARFRWESLRQNCWSTEEDDH